MVENYSHFSKLGQLGDDWRHTSQERSGFTRVGSDRDPDVLGVTQNSVQSGLIPDILIVAAVIVVSTIQ